MPTWAHGRGNDDTRAPGFARLRAAGGLHWRGRVRLAELLQGVDVVAVDGGGAAALDARHRRGARRLARGRARRPVRRRRAGRPSTGTTSSAPRPSAARSPRSSTPTRRRGSPACACACGGDARAGAIAANRWGRPADAMTLIAVTGTNGKTTTTFLVEGLVRAAGGRPGVIGTVEYRFGTAPVPGALHHADAARSCTRTLAEMRAAGVTHVAMEASSHALELGRLDGVRFRSAAFTNLTQDHLDFHGTMEAYAEAKAQAVHASISRETASASSTWTTSRARSCCRRCAAAALAVATERRADEILRDALEQTVGGIDARRSTTPIGDGARALAAHRRVQPGEPGGRRRHRRRARARRRDHRARARRRRGVPGRLERVPTTSAGFGVLRRLCAHARRARAGDGGAAAADARAADRRLRLRRRPRHDQAAQDGRGGGASSPICRSSPATTRAPRIPSAIIDDDRRRRARGAAKRRTGSSSRSTGGGDRARRIAAARPGDVVLIAGKGHEDYQIVGTDEAPLRRPRRGARGAREISQSAGERSELKAMAQVAIPASRVRARPPAARSRAGRPRACSRPSRSTAARCAPGALFFAVKGERFDGHDFAAPPVSARRRGRRGARGRGATLARAPASRSSRSTTSSRRSARSARRTARR